MGSISLDEDDVVFLANVSLGGSELVVSISNGQTSQISVSYGCFDISNGTLRIILDALVDPSAQPVEVVSAACVIGNFSDVIVAYNGCEEVSASVHVSQTQVLLGFSADAADCVSQDSHSNKRVIYIVAGTFGALALIVLVTGAVLFTLLRTGRLRWPSNLFWSPEYARELRLVASYSSPKYSPVYMEPESDDGVNPLHVPLLHAE